jgi:hypothetical protein
MIWNDMVKALALLKSLTHQVDVVSQQCALLETKVKELSQQIDVRNQETLKSLAATEARLSELLDAIEVAVIPSEAARFIFMVESDGNFMEIENMQMSVDKVCTLKIAPVDKFGNAAKVDGMPSWSLTDPSLGALAVDADGMGATFTPSGALGALSVQVNADADLGEGVKTIAGELPLELLAGEAAVVNVSGTVA